MNEENQRRIQQIRDRLQAASSYPWQREGNGHGEREVRDRDGCYLIVDAQYDATTPWRDEDYELISNAPQDLAFLLDLLE